MCAMDPALLFDKGARFHGQYSSQRPGRVLESNSNLTPTLSLKYSNSKPSSRHTHRSPSPQPLP